MKTPNRPRTQVLESTARTQALDFASRHIFADDGSGKQTVERARRYLVFITGREDLSDQTPLPLEADSA